MHLDDEGVLKFLVIVVDGLSGKSGGNRGQRPFFTVFEVFLSFLVLMFVPIIFLTLSQRFHLLQDDP